MFFLLLIESVRGTTGIRCNIHHGSLFTLQYKSMEKDAEFKHIQTISNQVITRKSSQLATASLYQDVSGLFPGLLEMLQEVYAVDCLVKLQFVQLVRLQLCDGKSLSESVWSIFLR